MQSSEKPKFFIARAAEPTLSSYSGETSTTRKRDWAFSFSMAWLEWKKA
jgi:hypothetical protein